MSHNTENSRAWYQTMPYIKLAPYTGYYQLRRKARMEDSAAQWATDSGTSYYYAWSIVRNRLRGVYPCGGRLGMCVSLEKTRTARFSPHTPYGWPPTNTVLPAWPYPTLLTGRYIANVSNPLSYMSSAANSLVFSWTINMSKVQTANDTHPPSGFSSDLKGVVVYIKNTRYPLQVYSPGSTARPNHNISLEPRYATLPVSITPTVGADVKSAGDAALAELTPGGIFWPYGSGMPTSSTTLDKARILPEVETWRELNLYPVGLATDRSLLYVCNFPLRHSDRYSGDMSAHSTMYREGQQTDDIVHVFGGLVYWVLREGPLDVVLSSTDAEIRVARHVITLLFESAVSTVEPNTHNRYHSAPELLVTSNSVSPRALGTNEGPALPYGFSPGPAYNTVMTEYGMTSVGAPADNATIQAPMSEILNSYGVPGDMCGNITLDQHTFRRISTAGNIPTYMWSETGRVFRYSAPFGIPTGVSLTLVGAMATVAAMGDLATNSFTNTRFPIYLGGFATSVLHNNTMPEVGVMLGLHRTTHTIYLMDSENVEITVLKADDAADQQIPVPGDINIVADDTVPLPIYTYYGLGASPHHITFMKDGRLLIPTDIGILDYDYINRAVVCEWLNPALFAFVANKLVRPDTSDFSVVLTPAEVTINSEKRVYLRPSTTSSASADIIFIDADDVYSATKHLGSYGQVAYEGSDFSTGLAIKLRR